MIIVSEHVCTFVWLHLLISEKREQNLKGLDEMEMDEVGIDEVGVQEIMAVGKLHVY